MVRDSTDRLQSWHDRFARLGIDSPLSHPLYFKKELHIGEDVYKSLRVKKKLLKLLNTLGAAGGGATIASSSTVAATFFPAGILGALGLAAATTPIGWVIGTAVFSGVAWKLINDRLDSLYAIRVIEIPKFVNTPLDLLAVSIFDLICSLAVKLAAIDGEFRLSSNGCGWVEARSAGRRGVLAARVASELTAHGVHLTGGGRGAPWPGVGRSGVAAGRPACQRATRVLRCATALRVTHRPSLRSSSRYGPCGPAWTGASRPSTTTRKARRLAVRG